MRSRRVLRQITPGLVAGSLLLASAACSSATQSSTTQPSASSGAGATLDAAGLPKPELQNVTAGLLESVNHPVDIARYDNLFQKYGVTLKIENFTSDSNEVDALLAGQIQIALNVGNAALLASQLTSTTLESVYIGQTNIDDNMYAVQSIKTGPELTGHSIAVSSFASVTYGEALIALQQLHLTPSQVTITAIGDDAQRTAALVAGSVGASLNDKAEAPQMNARGLHVLVPLSQLANADFPAGNTAIPKSFVQKYPNTVLAIVAALTEGTHLFLTDSALAIKAGEVEEGMTASASTQQVQYDLQGWRPDNGYMKLSDYQEQQVIYEKSDPQLKSVNPADAIDDQFINELKTDGFDQKNGIPVNCNGCGP